MTKVVTNHKIDIRLHEDIELPYNSNYNLQYERLNDLRCKGTYAVMQLKLQNS